MSDTGHDTSFEENVETASEVRIPLHDLLQLDFDRPEVGDRIAEVTMPVAPTALGFTGALHGGAIANARRRPRHRAGIVLAKPAAGYRSDIAGPTSGPLAR